MTSIRINENSLSKLVCNAQNRIEVYDGISYYLVPLRTNSPKSNYHFIAKSIVNGAEVVLNYKKIRKIIIDYTCFNCI